MESSRHSEFPHGADDVKFEASWIFPIICGFPWGPRQRLFELRQWRLDVSIIIAFNVKKLIMMTYHRWRLPSLFGKARPSSVRRLTETTGSSTDIDSSAGFSKQQTEVTNGGFSRESTGITVSSLYERIFKKATSSHRQPDGCESGKGDIQ